MKTRNAKSYRKNITTERFEEAMQKYARAGAREAEINKSVETEVQNLLHKYETELMCLTQSKNIAFEIVQSYCIENKGELFSRRRSIGTHYGIAGFRLGTPRLKTGKNTDWNKILVQLKEKLPGYVRIAEEPAKHMLLADRHKEEVAPVLVELGIQIVQDELFYIETRKAA